MAESKPPVRSVNVQNNVELFAWRWMRISALLLIPLVWVHVLIQDILVGVHAMDLTYVQFRWANILWRIFDGLLLGFAFAHGVNGLRQVLFDFVYSERGRRTLTILLFLLWLVITLVGLIALVAGVNTPIPGK